MQHLEHLMSGARPLRLLFLSMDGVLPQAYMHQQRQHRFLAVHRQNLSNSADVQVCLAALTMDPSSLCQSPVTPLY
jgi:5'-3' exonuclease